ncbi:MAG: GTP-binding protein [Candidatus Hodarchaeota archaeon]
MSGLPRKQFKVCLIGDGYVGKTSIRRRYLGSVFKRNYIATLGVDFAQKSLTFEGASVYLVIWDIAGQPLYQGLRRRYYEGCSGMLLVYSVVDRASFDNASKWLVEAHGYMNGLPPLIIAGNKIDLRPTHPQEEIVSYEEGQAFTKKIGEKLNTPSIFIETSALTGENIDDAFNSLTKLMIDEIEKSSLSYLGESATHEPEPQADSRTEAPRVPSTAPRTPERQAHRDDSVLSERVSLLHDKSEIDEPEAMAPEVIVLQEEHVKQDEIKTVGLRADLRSVESELSEMTERFDKALLNLRNVVQVKRIMYEHLQKQLRQTRQEWADAYEEYMETDKRKKADLAEKTRKIEEIKKRLEKEEKS